VDDYQKYRKFYGSNGDPEPKAVKNYKSDLDEFRSFNWDDFSLSEPAHQYRVV
jgi:hypothetical protein